jgi:hypothetical protein
MLPSTRVIARPALVLDLDSSRSLPSTAVIEREDRAVDLDPNESDADWEARLIATFERRLRVFALRD